MKKFFINFFKILGFFTLWAVSLSVIDFDFKDPVLWRFWAELVPLISVVVYTLIFTSLEKNKISISIKENFTKASFKGTVLGLFWIILPVLILIFSKSAKLEGKNNISYLEVWILSAFINVIMQELLVRGYIYSLLKSQYSTRTAIFISTLIFTLVHGGAFEAGIIPVLNVISMSLFMGILYEYENSLMAPILAHSIWNIVGGIILGTVSLAPDYPNLFSFNIYNSSSIPATSYKIEYSLIILLVNLLLSAYYYIKIKNRDKNIS